MTKRPSEGLVRAIGTRALGVNIFNLVVGGGIFVLPGVVAARLGSAALLAYLVCAVAVGLVFLCFAEVGSRVTRSGGVYAYIEAAFGPLAGFVTMAVYWLGLSVMADAAITVAMVDTLAVAVPALEAPLVRGLFIVGVYAFFVGINITGVKSGVRLFVVNTIAKLVPLLLLLVAGLFAMNIEHLAVTEWPTAQQVGAGALLLFFAFMGAESALSVSGEIRNPSKTVPRGMFLGLAGILMLYVGLQAVSQGVLGEALAHNAEAPLAATAVRVLGAWGGTLLLFGGAISIFSTLSSDVMNTPRLLFASALDGNLPKGLARVHPRYRTPYRAIVAHATLICVVALSGAFETLAVLASGSALLVYLGVSLAVLRLRRRDGLPVPGQFRLPGGPVIPLLSGLVIVWLLWHLRPEEAMGLGVLVGVAVVVYGVRAAYRYGRPAVSSPVDPGGVPVPPLTTPPVPPV